MGKLMGDAGYIIESNVRIFTSCPTCHGEGKVVDLSRFVRPSKFDYLVKFTQIICEDIKLAIVDDVGITGLGVTLLIFGMVGLLFIIFSSLFGAFSARHLIFIWCLPGIAALYGIGWCVVKFIKQTVKWFRSVIKRTDSEMKGF